MIKCYRPGWQRLFPVFMMAICGNQVLNFCDSRLPVETGCCILNCYNGRIGLINSGGASSGQSDTKEAIRTAVINKRAGGMGLISGRKAFQRPFNEGVALLQAIQDVYLSKDIDIA